MDRESQQKLGGESAAQAYQRLLKAWERHSHALTDDDEDGWTAQDMVRQLQKDRYSARFIEDIEAVASETELKTVKIDDLIQKLKDWYKPSKNPTTTRYNFHRLTQKEEESFDSFVNKVKFEARHCNFKCSNATCDVSNSLIRDQIILGVSNDELRKRALREEWNLDKLEDEGRNAETGLLLLSNTSTEMSEKLNDRIRSLKYPSKATEKTKLLENDITTKLKLSEIDIIDTKLQEKENNKMKLNEKDKSKLFEKVIPKTKLHEKEGIKIKVNDKDGSKLKFYDKESTKLKHHDKECIKMKPHEKESTKGKHHTKESTKGKHHEKEFSKVKYHDKDCLKMKLHEKEGKSKKHLHCCRCDRDTYNNYDHFAAVKIPCHPCNQRGLCSSCVMCTSAVLETQKRYQKLSERDMFGKKLCHLTDDTYSASDTEDMYKGKSAKAYHVTDESGSPSDTETGEATDDVFLMDGKQNNTLKQKVSKMKTVFRLNGARKGQHRRHRHKKADYKVDIRINNHIVTVTTDTGAEINVLPQHMAEILDLPLQTSEMKISPYGAKPFKVVGKYEGCVTFGSTVVRSKWYIVDKKNIEPLLSGTTAEQLGIIKFISKPLEYKDSVRRRSKKVKEGSKARYYLQKLERAFNGLGKLNGYDVQLYINEDTKPMTRQAVPSPVSLENSFENEINWMDAEDTIDIEEHNADSSWTSVVPSPKNNRNIKITVDMRQANTETNNKNQSMKRKDDSIERRLTCNGLNKSIYDVH